MSDERVDVLIEYIPDHDSVFMRAYKDRMKDGLPKPSAFEPHGGSVSFEWEKYTTADQTHARAKTPSHNAIVSLGVGAIRAISESVDVLHAPLPENHSHCQVPVPPDRAVDTEIRLKLSRLAMVVIPLR